MTGINFSWTDNFSMLEAGSVTKLYNMYFVNCSHFGP